ncbi:uncharacterized protein FOMMEDRAFT_151619 [Fomitiporia mediterranea MF3/22]|uniref:uncharacterized protein n=1 Tax=Fomitiporia mediterranea (strain MF3/22) TaxID=694068 RepID=UPI000440898B|nr:uncharacterized protein FOMMEDRAFT_151619 [Fomitiporia mediterranea MF3/22]EJD06379.1 hypothetical protein FOMMEDRAFT_151619 [Fomitiporia mediterranea MF3/22]
MPQHSVYHILSTWRLEGEVKTTLLPKPGRPRVLDFADTQFLLKTVTHYNNMYLDELRAVLED